MPAQEGTTLCSTRIAPDYPLRRGVQARARASRELSRPVWVTGQSGQSKLHTTGEHRPGGPTTTGAEPDASGVRRACTTQPGPGAAGLGTSGEVGPGTDVKPPRREDHAGSRRSWAGAERSPMDGGGTRVHVVDIDGARRRSHEPTAGWLELGLGWPESTHRWTGTPGRAASLDCSGRSKERDAGRARLDRVEGRDSRRTGPSRIQDVLLGRMVR